MQTIVTRDNYTDPDNQMNFLSAGQFRSFSKCEYGAMQRRNGNVPYTNHGGYVTGADSCCMHCYSGMRYKIE